MAHQRAADAAGDVRPKFLATMTADEATELVKSALAEYLEGHESAPRPTLLTPKQLAEELQVSTRTIATLRSKGMPVVMVGDAPRYVLEDVLEHLRAAKRTES